MKVFESLLHRCYTIYITLCKVQDSVLNFICMCKIFIAGPSGPMVAVAQDLKLEDAIQFGLNLHRSSNVEHTVFVLKDNGDQVVLLTNIQE